jgi:hypothetical protein
MELEQPSPRRIPSISRVADSWKRGVNALLTQIHHWLDSNHLSRVESRYGSVKSGDPQDRRDWDGARFAHSGCGQTGRSTEGRVERSVLNHRRWDAGITIIKPKRRFACGWRPLGRPDSLHVQGDQIAAVRDGGAARSAMPTTVAMSGVVSTKPVIRISVVFRGRVFKAALPTPCPC